MPHIVTRGDARDERGPGARSGPYETQYRILRGYDVSAPPEVSADDEPVYLAAARAPRRRRERQG